MPQEVMRLSVALLSFVNVPELMSRVRYFMDILTSNQLGDLVQRPDVIGGGRQVIVTPALMATKTIKRPRAAY